MTPNRFGIWAAAKDERGLRLIVAKGCRRPLQGFDHQRRLWEWRINYGQEAWEGKLEMDRDRSDMFKQSFVLGNMLLKHSMIQKQKDLPWTVVKN